MVRYRRSLQGIAGSLSAEAASPCPRSHRPHCVSFVLPFGLHLRHDLHGRWRNRVAPFRDLEGSRMSFAKTSDGIRLFYETAGLGTPIIFVHEFGGSHWSWEPQLNFFARRHQCITFAARGYPPSDIPEQVDAYSQARAADDIVDVLS